MEWDAKNSKHFLSSLTDQALKLLWVLFLKCLFSSYHIRPEGILHAKMLQLYPWNFYLINNLKDFYVILDSKVFIFW